jgi:hypothetical protein
MVSIFPSSRANFKLSKMKRDGGIGTARQSIEGSSQVCKERGNKKQLQFLKGGKGQKR